MQPRRLLQEVREVSRLADPANPVAVTQRAFDAARAESETYAHLPSARAIARQLGWSWQKVLQVANSPAKTHGKALQAQEAYAQGSLTAEYIAYALKLVAKRLDKTTVTESEYDAEIDAMLTENRKRWLHGRLWLPSAAQISLFTRLELYGTSSAGTSSVGTWDRALELTGLELTENRNRKTTARPLPTIELLERYHEQHGIEPTPRRLWKFAKDNDLPYAVIGSQKRWSKIIKLWRSKRAAQRLPAPGAPQPTTSTEHALALLRVPRQPKKTVHSLWGSRERCLDILIQYLEQIPKNKHATGRGYAAWAKQQPYRTPDLEAFKKHGGWAAMLELAHEKMLESESDTSLP